jgi:thiosulfate/3-mercaptopyruvate sulfurtransferase
MRNHPAVGIGTGALFFAVLLMSILGLSGALPVLSGATEGGQASAIPTADLIQPAALAKMVQVSASDKPLIIQIGSRVLYEEAHIPGSEYIGPASSAEGRENLRQRLQSVSRGKVVILYCGCCPWSHCPNVKPAWDVVQSLGFSKAKILYIADNFGADWIDKGYPVAKGQ